MGEAERRIMDHDRWPHRPDARRPAPFGRPGSWLASRGVTLVEMVIAMILLACVFGVVMQMTSTVRRVTGRGTSNLQNLQEARLAITALRRDFAAACPVFARADSERDRERLRRMPVRRHSGEAVGGQSSPILVGDQELIFHRFRGDPAPGGGPFVIEPVRYGFDPAAGHLIRTTPRQTTVFKGIRQVAFNVYAHPANPAAPLLWVKLEVAQPKPDLASGPTLTLTTTCRSVMATDLANHPEWYLLTAKQPN